MVVLFASGYIRKHKGNYCFQQYSVNFFIVIFSLRKENHCTLVAESKLE